MFSTVENMIWTARRVYRHQRTIRQMLDPRAYERHGRSRWIPDASQARRMDVAHAIAAAFLAVVIAALVVAWFQGVI